MLRTTIVLLTVALGLLAFIVFFERGTLSTSEREGRKGRVLASFVRQRVTRVELQRHGVTTALEHVPAAADDPLDAGSWRVTAPFRAKADQAAVDNLLSALEWAEARRSLGDASAEEQKQFGLDAPRYRVHFVAGKERSGFSVGLPAATGGGSYLSVQGEPAVYVVGSELLEALDQAPEDFHDKNLHEGLSIHTLERVALTSAGEPERKLGKRDGFFWLESPFGALASTPGVTTWIDTLDGMRAARYVADNARPEFGFDKPKLALSVDSLIYDKAVKDKRTAEHFALQVGATCHDHPGEAYVQVDRKLVYCVADNELKKLDVAALALRETRVLPLEDVSITDVELKDGTRELALHTQDQATRYRLTERDRELQSGVADPAALTEWYAALRGLTIESFEALSPTLRDRLETTGVTVTFRRGKTQGPYVLRLADESGVVIATRLQEAALLRLPEAARTLLSPDAARFRKKRLLDENEAQFEALTLTRPGVVERVVKEASGYTLLVPVHAPAESSTIDEIVRLMSKLEVVRFVADAAKPEHGFATPFRTLSVEYKADGKREHTLVLGASAPGGGRFAKLDADAAVFVVTDGLVNKLSDPLLRRSAAALSKDQFVKLEISSAGKRVEILQGVEGPEVVGAGADSRARAVRLTDALTHLTAARVEAYDVPGLALAAGPIAGEITASQPGAAARRFRIFAGPTTPTADAGPGANEPLWRLRRSDLPVTFLITQASVDRLLERSSGKPGR